jgi:F-type H+-transporting ATPase subunit gamma
MTERLGDIEARIATVHQLETVITAMRGIAAARSREARTRLDGIRTYAKSVGAAIGEALAFLPQSGEPAVPEPASLGPARGGTVVLALCAEQGFVGSFNGRVLDRVAALKIVAAHDLLLVGDRGLMAAGEREMQVAWSAAMVAHADEVPALADRIADALYQRIEAGAARVLLVHAVPDHLQGEMNDRSVVIHQLVPFDYARFPVSRRAVAPLITLPPQVLLAQLAQEFVFAEICEALMLSFSAENEARMQAMIAANNNVRRRREELLGDYRRLRQEGITNEVIELAASRTTG